MPFGLASWASARSWASPAVSDTVRGKCSGQPPVGRTGLAALPAPPVPGPSVGGLPYASESLSQARSWVGTRYLFGGCSPAASTAVASSRQSFMRLASACRVPASCNKTPPSARVCHQPKTGHLVFFYRTYYDAGQDWTHVGVVSRVDSNGTVWMIDAPGARATGDPPDAPFGQVRRPLRVPGSSIDLPMPGFRFGSSSFSAIVSGLSPMTSVGAYPGTYHRRGPPRRLNHRGRGQQGSGNARVDQPAAARSFRARSPRLRRRNTAL